MCRTKMAARCENCHRRSRQFVAVLLPFCVPSSIASAWANKENKSCSFPSLLAHRSLLTAHCLLPDAAFFCFCMAAMLLDSTLLSDVVVLFVFTKCSLGL